MSHAIGEGEAKGHYVSGFDHPRIRLPDKNGAGWSGNEASKGGDFAMPWQAGNHQSPSYRLINVLPTIKAGTRGGAYSGSGGERMQSGPIGGAQREAGTGQRDATAGHHAQPPHHTGGRSTLLHGTAASLREIPDLEIFLQNVNERMHYHPCVLVMSSSVYATGVCV